MSRPQLQSAPVAQASQSEGQRESRNRLSIILVNYNGKQYLGPCLRSVFLFAPEGTQVILEDNASTDNSLDELANQFPSVQIIRSERNLGFAGGNNLASQRAEGRFLLLLNVDTELLQPIEPLLDWLDHHRSYGALTINMVNGQREPAACTGRFPTPFRLALLRQMLVRPEEYGSAETYDVDWLQGSFLLIRRDLWNRIGGLDEGFFMYSEDVDLCRRIWDSGAKCAYLQRYSYLHWGGFDSSRFPDQVIGLSRYVSKHLHGLYGRLCRAVLIFGCFARAFFYATKSFIGRNQSDLKTAKSCWRAFQVLVRNQPVASSSADPALNREKSQLLGP